MEWLGFGPTDPADDSFVVTMHNLKVCAPFAETTSPQNALAYRALDIENNRCIDQ